ncbi:MAG: alpha-hydroxy acid oxidase, partial [Thermoplasmatota archaeon]
PVLGWRDAERRAGWHAPPDVPLANLPQEGGASDRIAYAARAFDPSLTWDDIDWLRSLSDLPVIVKGILDPRDARLAVEHGAAGVIVSNHGGRQLDGAPAALDALPAVAKALAGARALVLMDGGARRGTDVVKALALGAHGVGIGRPLLAALAVGGEGAVSHTLAILRGETENALALLGVPAVSRLGRDALRETNK